MLAGGLEAILLCRDAGFRKIYLRGDTDFTQTQQLDAWDAEAVTFLFGIDARPNLKAIAEDRPASDWAELQRLPQRGTPPPSEIRGDAYEPPEEQTGDQPRRPVTEYRLGRVKAVVWQNETQLGARHSVQFFRLYKPEGSEHWQSATSFNRDDLPLIAKLADLAMMFIYGSQQSEGI